MKNALQFLFVAFWLFVSCMPIIFTARYMEKVDVLILIFGYILNKPQDAGVST
ncbi:hypothetical protein RX08_00235 [Escherichia coli]|nr:hypothetical protein RX08_00235 [Escherichia coli]